MVKDMVEVFEGLNDLCDWMHVREVWAAEDARTFAGCGETAAMNAASQRSMAYYICRTKLDFLLERMFG